MNMPNQQAASILRSDQKPNPTIRLLELIADSIARQLIAEKKTSSSDSKSCEK